MNQFDTDIAIVGGGPAGLATADTLMRGGHSVVVLEKGPVAGHVARYPTYMNFFSTADLVELGGMPLTIAREKPTKQEYLNYLRRFVVDRGIDVRIRHEVAGLEGAAGDFILSGKGPLGERFEIRASRVILATGAYATPQKLGVPGEDLPKVSHYFTEVHSYFGSKVLIVGGGNSAVETALEMWRAGIDVRLCHRREEFRVKYWIGPDIENRISNREIPAWRPARVIEIKPASVILQVRDEPPFEIENDYVLALTGYRPDPALLGRFGITADPETGRPVHNAETLESERPGLYIAGVMLAGNVSSEIFIENSRFHGDRILRHLNNGRSASATANR